MSGSFRKDGLWHSMQALHARCLEDLMDAGRQQDMPCQWFEIPLRKGHGGANMQQKTWQQLLEHFQHALSSRPAAGTDSGSWQPSSSWWGIDSSASRLWTLEAAVLQQQRVCLQAVPAHLHPSMAPVLEEASAALLPRTYLQLVGQALLAAAAGMLPDLLQAGLEEEGELQQVVAGLLCHPFAAAVQEAATWLTTSALTAQGSGDPSPLLPLVDPSTSPGPAPLRHSFRKPYRSLPSVGTGMWALGGASSSLTGPGSLTAALQQLEADVAGFSSGLAALADAAGEEAGQPGAEGLVVCCLEVQVAGAWAAAGPGLDALLDAALMAEVQRLLVHAANQTAEEVWATAGTPPPDLLNPHPAGTLAASQEPGTMAPPQPPAAQDGRAAAPVQSASQDMAASCPAASGMEALQQQLHQASSSQGSAAAGDRVLAQAATAAAGAAAEAVAALQLLQRATTAQWVPLRISNNTARLLVLVRTLLLKVVQLPAALRGGLVVSLLRAVLRLLASLLEGLQGCAGDTPGIAASPPQPGRKEGPGAVALGCCDASMAAGLLSQACWPAPDQLGVVGPQVVALVTDLLAEARGQAAALTRVLAQALVGHHLELLLGVVSPGLSCGMAWGSPSAHMAAGGVGASAPLRLWVLLQQRWQVAVALSCPPALACHLLQLVTTTSTCWLVDLYSGLVPCWAALPQLLADATLLIQATRAADQQAAFVRRAAAAASSGEGSRSGVGLRTGSCRSRSGGGCPLAAAAAAAASEEVGEDGSSASYQLSRACHVLWTHTRQLVHAHQPPPGLDAEPARPAASHDHVASGNRQQSSTAAGAAQNGRHGPQRPASSPEMRLQALCPGEEGSGGDRGSPWAWLPSELKPLSALLGTGLRERASAGGSLAPLPLQLPPRSLPHGRSTNSALLVSQQ